MDWKETFEDLWWGSFDNNGEKNSHEYEKMVSFIENFLEQERNKFTEIKDGNGNSIKGVKGMYSYNGAIMVWTEQALYSNDPSIINK